MLDKMEDVKQQYIHERGQIFHHPETDGSIQLVNATNAFNWQAALHNVSINFRWKIDHANLGSHQDQ